MKLTYAMLLALALSGCAGESLLLVNDSGETIKCETTSMEAIMLGRIPQYLYMKNCTDNANKKGYK